MNFMALFGFVCFVLFFFKIWVGLGLSCFSGLHACFPSECERFSL